MIVRLEIVEQLKSALEKILLFDGHPQLSHYDFQVIQHINNIEYYLISDANYDASFQISILNQLLKDCSPKLAEHLKPFLANL